MAGNQESELPFGYRSHIAEALTQDDPESQCWAMFSYDELDMLISPHGGKMPGKSSSDLMSYDPMKVPEPWDSTYPDDLSRAKNIDNALYKLLYGEVRGWNDFSDPMLKKKLPWPTIETLVFLVGVEFGCVRVISMLLSGGHGSAIDPNYNRGEARALSFASSNGYIEILKLLLTHKRIDSSSFNNEVGRAAKNGHIDVVKLLMSDERVDPSAKDSEAVWKAISNGHTEIVKLLLTDKRVNPAGHKNKALRTAALNENFELLKLFLSDSRVNPSDKDNLALRQAIYFEKFEIIEFLLADKRTDPSMRNSAIIAWVADNPESSIEMMRTLLSDKRVDPSVRDQYALNQALFHGRLEMAQLLLTDKRVVFTREALGTADAMMSQGDFRALLTICPRLWPGIIGNNTKCEKEGRLQPELNRIEKDSSMILLLCVKRQFTPTVAARVGDVLREVCAEWTRYSTVEVHINWMELDRFQCGEEWLEGDEEGAEELMEELMEYSGEYYGDGW